MGGVTSYASSSGACIAVSLNEKIYVSGGYYRDVPCGENHLNTVECFDPVSNTWQIMSPMPVRF